MGSRAKPDQLSLTQCQQQQGSLAVAVQPACSTRGFGSPGGVLCYSESHAAVPDVIDEKMSPPFDIEDTRSVIRKRRPLVEKLSREVHKVEAKLKACGVALPVYSHPTVHQPAHTAPKSTGSLTITPANAANSAAPASVGRSLSQPRTVAGDASTTSHPSAKGQDGSTARIPQRSPLLTATSPSAVPLTAEEELASCLTSPVPRLKLNLHGREVTGRKKKVVIAPPAGAAPDPPTAATPCRLDGLLLPQDPQALLPVLYSLNAPSNTDTQQLSQGQQQQQQLSAMQQQQQQQQGLHVSWQAYQAGYGTAMGGVSTGSGAGAWAAAACGGGGGGPGGSVGTWCGAAGQAGSSQAGPYAASAASGPHQRFSAAQRSVDRPPGPPAALMQ
ncbi:hypothetical protein QJQ45_028897, partial [Haematococcus lacustris]